jgi:ribonucleoside-triphosphate reductase
MKTLPEIEKEINVLGEKMKNVKGRDTEVYTRIVGYHRDVRNWNRGKKEEYKDRLTFKTNRDQVTERMKVKGNDIHAERQKEREEMIKADNVAFYKFFYSQVCRNCPPVKDYVKNLTIPGEEVDVTSDLGLNSARKYDVLSTPTVILFDKNEEVVEKLNSVEDLKKIFAK